MNCATLYQAWIAAERERPTDRIRLPADCLPHLARIMRARQEKFAAVSLAGDHSVIRVRVVTVGLVNRALVHAREVFRGAIADNSTAVIVAHNHPSGSLEPSPGDLELTRRLAEAGMLLGIPVLDHIIVGRRGYVSLLERGELDQQLNGASANRDVAPSTFGR